MIGFLARSTCTMGEPLQCQACKIYVLSHQIIKMEPNNSTGGDETTTGVIVASHAYQTNHNTSNNNATAAATTTDIPKNGTNSSRAMKRKLPTTQVGERGSTTASKAVVKTYTRKTFEERLADLTRFQKVNGHCNVPYMNSEGQISRLAEWVKLVRAGKTKLAPEQRQQLVALGFCWEKKKDADWKAMFAQLQKYRATYGDCLVPWEWSQDKKLSQWVHTQRKQKAKNKIRADRKELLDSIGMVWRPSERNK